MASKTRASKDVDSDVVSCKDLETVVGNAMKKHLDAFREEMKTLLIDHLGNLENRVKDLETRVRDLEKDLNEKTDRILHLESTADSIISLPKPDTLVLKSDFQAVKELARTGSIAANDCEQYSRRHNIRIRGLKIPEDANVPEFVATWINATLDFPNITSDDIAAAHPLPVRKTGPPHESSASSIPHILVRFHRKDLRDSVISARKVLKKSNVSIADDLTGLNI